MKKNKPIFLTPILIFSNLFPLYGVIMYNWTIFTVVYIYWLELLVISTFSLLKIIVAKGDKSILMFEKIRLAIQFFLFRTGIFFFYLLFIVTFLGVLIVKPNTGEKAIDFINILFLRDPFFRLTIINFIIYNLIEFIVLYILSGKYKTALPMDNYVILDSHILVVHIVVVLGTFLYQFMEKNTRLDSQSMMIACVSLFIIVKMFTDLVKLNMNPKKNEEEIGDFI